MQYADAAVRGDFEFKCDLTSIVCTSKLASSNTLVDWKRQYSTDIKFVDGGDMTKDKIYEELVLLHGMSSEDMCDIKSLQGKRLPAKPSSKRTDLAGMLVAARQEYQQSQPPPAMPSGGGTSGGARLLQGGKFAMTHWQLRNHLESFA